MDGERWRTNRRRLGADFVLGGCHFVVLPLLPRDTTLYVDTMTVTWRILSSGLDPILTGSMERDATESSAILLTLITLWAANTQYSLLPH